ncbi:unspecific monooxygenase [Cooperia oncophora]
MIFRTNLRRPVFYLAALVPCLRIPLRKLFIAAAPLRESKVPALFQKIYKTIDERIEARAENAAQGIASQERTDFIDLFLDARAEQDFDNKAEFSKDRSSSKVSKHLTREEITAQCFVFLLAGFDTTATSLAFATHLLAKHPSVQKNLQEEIDQHCNRESISYETLTSLRYLDAVIKETLRMYPLATVANSRRCMKATTLGGVRIQEGENVCADTLTIHFNRELWGDDADDFRPERWLEQSDRPSAAFLSFGLGPRQCIGMRLALMEEKLVLAHLLQRYNIVATCDTEEDLVPHRFDDIRSEVCYRSTATEVSPLNMYLICMYKYSGESVTCQTFYRCFQINSIDSKIDSDGVGDRHTRPVS